MKRCYQVTLLLCVLILNACQNQPKVAKEDLTPWIDDIMYFVLTDRFADGNPNNNGQGFGEYDTTDENMFHGGDFSGLKAQLPYLKKLGITSLWLSPPVMNAVWSRDSAITGYHGYWASHFMKTDPHLGSLQEYQELVKTLQSEGIKVVQDVVTNHTGDYFSYQGTFNPLKPEQNFHSRGRPLQKPFDQNDVRVSKDRHAGIYHFTPSIQDYNNPDQKLRWQMSDLDDLNTENPEVISALKKSFRFWMDSAGIDGIRFDTPLYVDHPFWHSFLHDSSAGDPGLKKHALVTGKPHFFTFGETWVHSNPYKADGEKKAQNYLGSKQHPEMDGILHFPMQQSIHRVFAGGAPPSELVYRLAVEDSLFPSPWQRLHFIDNHDMPRFRASASEEATRQALAFIMTIPGIPVLYYGTEQGLTSTRANLFNQLDSNSQDFKFTRQLISLRKSSKVFSRGKLRLLADEKLQSGLFAYEMSYKGETKWVFFNTSESAIHTGKLPISGKQGQMKALMQQGKVEFGHVQAGELGYLYMSPKSWVVADLTPAAGNPAVENGALRLLTPIADTLRSAELKLEGLCLGYDSLRLFVNGIEELPCKVSTQQAMFKSTLSLVNIPFGQHQLVWIGWKRGQAHLAGRQLIFTDLPVKKWMQKSDPVGDDLGPNGLYRYPIAFEGLKSIDFTKAVLLDQGNALELHLHFNKAFSKAWNPPLGFDHLQLMVLINVNKGKGAKSLKEAHYSMPNKGSFTHYISLNGWQIQAFEASEQGNLAATAAAPQFSLLGEKSMRLRISPAFLGYPEKLEHIEIHVLGWDSAGEGGLRPLSPSGGPYEFGGGKSSDPKWIDRIVLQATYAH